MYMYNLVMTRLFNLSVPFQSLHSELDYEINYTINRHPLNGTGERKYDAS